jgi:hypothetical protein
VPVTILFSDLIGFTTLSKKLIKGPGRAAQ